MRLPRHVDLMKLCRQREIRKHILTPYKFRYVYEVLMTLSELDSKKYPDEVDLVTV